MLKKIQKIASHHSVFLRYFIVGTFVTGLDLLTLFFLYEIIQFPLLLSTTLAFLVAMTTSFFLNKIWTFKNGSRNFRKLYIKFFLVSCVGLFLTNFLMWFLTLVIGIWYLFSKVLVSGVVLLWNFLANKYWTFRPDPRHEVFQEDHGIELSIIIPAYNEEHRIRPTLLSIWDYLRETEVSSEIIVVDDGSNDKTVEVVSRKMKDIPVLKLLKLKKNQGKGFAVRTGVKEAKGKFILLADADNSTPIEELEEFLKTATNVDIIVGSRYLPGSQVKIAQPWNRIIMSRIANFLVRLFLIDHVKDTQCGFKLFRSSVAKDLFSRQKLKRWGFDMEVLAIAESMGYSIVELPVRWFNSPESRVSPVKDAFRGIWELVQIKINLWSGRYK